MKTIKAGRWLSVLVIVLIAIPLIVGGCYKAAPPPTPAPTPTPSPTPAPAPEPALSLAVTCEIKGFAFNPQSITVKKGTAIRWNQQDSAPHTATSTSSPPGAEFDSGNLRQGETFDLTFTVVGTYEYYCRIHPSMTGKIIVGE